MEVIHYIPGDIVFRVDHDDGPNLQWFKEKLFAQPEVADDDDLKQAVERIDDSRIITFDRGDGTGCLGMIIKFIQGLIWRITGRLFWINTRYFSLVFVSLPAERYGYDANFTVTTTNHLNLLQKITEVDQKTGSRLYRDAPVTATPAYAQKSVVAHDEAPVEPEFPLHPRHIYEAVIVPPIFDVHSATFNWVGGGAPGQGVPVGGPGTQPQPGNLAAAPPGGGRVTVQGMKVDLPIVSQAILTPKPVDIFILDAVPDGVTPLQISDLENFLASTAAAANPAVPNTPLVRWLRTHAGSLTADLDTTAPPSSPNPLGAPPDLANPEDAKTMMEWLNSDKTGIALLRHYDLAKNVYNMSSHGVFIADIICGVTNAAGNSDVPQTIRLIQVLSKWGVGTMETVARGLHKVYQYQQTSSNPAVVNCSFTLQIPRHDSRRVGHMIPNGGVYDQKYVNGIRALVETSDPAKRLRDTLEPVFQLLHKRGALIVAAAGNEWERHQNPGSKSDQRPIARYPAAFRDVIGVAALEQKSGDAIAPYSNRADEPENEGFAAYGGGISAQPGPHGEIYADPQNSIEGLYLSDFPDGTSAKDAGWLAFWSGTSFAAPIITGALALRLSQGFTSNDAIEHLRKQQNLLTPEGEEIVEVQ